MELEYNGVALFSFIIMLILCSILNLSLSRYFCAAEDPYVN